MTKEEFEAELKAMAYNEYLDIKEYFEQGDDGDGL